MFADDTQIATSSDDIKVITETLNRDLNNVANWLSANKLTLNNSKTEYMIIGSKKRLSQVTADPSTLLISKSYYDSKVGVKILGSE